MTAPRRRGLVSQAVRGTPHCATCIAPIDILDDLLRDEGFADVRYVPEAPGPRVMRSPPRCPE